MTIDEAIAHAREVATEQKRRSGACVINDNECDKFSACIKCAEEHEQLAEWLEELKESRHCMEENRKAGYNHGFTDGFNKAIDDFKSEVKDLINNSAVIRHKDVDEIAEQLKESEAE